MLLRDLRVLLLHGHEAQVADVVRDARLVVERLVELESALVMRAPLDRVGLPVGEVSRRGVGCRKDRGIRLWRDRGQEAKQLLNGPAAVAVQIG